LLFVKYCNQCIHVIVCLSAHICQTSDVQTSQIFLYMLTVAMAQSSSDDNGVGQPSPVRTFCRPLQLEID